MLPLTPSKGDAEMCQMLLDEGADVTQRVEGATALFTSSFNGHFSIPANNEEITPLNSACAEGQVHQAACAEGQVNQANNEGFTPHLCS